MNIEGELGKLLEMIFDHEIYAQTIDNMSKTNLKRISFKIL